MNEFIGNGQYHPASGSFLVCNRILTFRKLISISPECVYYELAIIMQWHIGIAHVLREYIYPVIGRKPTARTIWI